MLKKIITILFIFCILIVASAIAFAYFHEDEVKSYAIQSLNKHLQAEVNVGDVQFSVLKTFPMASLEFKNVSAMESWQKTKVDTLFFAKSIFLKFNVWDIYHQEYKVKELEIRDAEINLKVDEAGTKNYNFWKSKKDGKDKNDLSFQLEKVIADNVDFHYQNKPNHSLAHLDLNKTYFTGDFHKSVFTVNIDSDFLIKELNKNGEAVISDRRMNVMGEIAVDTDKSLYTFKNTSLNLDGIDLLLSGKLRMTEESDLDIAFSGKDVKFRKVLAFLNEGEKAFLANYKIEGKANLRGEIAATLTGESSPHVDLDIEVSDASFEKPANNFALHHIELSGSYSNGKENSKKSSWLMLEEFSAGLGSGSISGNLKLENFEKPKFALQSQMALQLSDISQYLDLMNLQQLKGGVAINIQSKGTLTNMDQLQVADWKNATSVGDIEFTDVSFKLKDRPQKFNDLSGTLKIVNNSLLAENLQVSISQSDFRLNGKFINLIAFLLDEKQALMVDASFISEHIALDELLLSDKKKKEGGDDYLFSISDRINLDLEAKIKHLNFKKFSFKDCQSHISIKDQVLQANKIHFESLGGSIDGSMKVDARNEQHLLISSHSTSRNIDMKQLFNDFNNFGQEVLTSDNLEGIASADIDFRSRWSPKLELDENSLELNGSFLIEEGRLLNFEPLSKLSNYISLEELNDIRFSTLENSISINDGRILIPEFEIKSSAMDLSLEGSHSFDNQIDYRIELIVDQLLGMKIKKPEKERVTEFGYVQDDGLGRSKLFLKMTGNLENPDITYDTKQLREHWKQELKKEKQKVKNILHEEFGLFKDSSKENVKKTEATNEKEQEPFQIEWGEEQNKEEEKEPKVSAERTKKKEKSAFSNFFDKIAEPNQDEYIPSNPE